MKYVIDRFLIFIISPIIPALASVLTIPKVMYLHEAYTILYFVFILILIKLTKIEKINASIFYPLLIVIAVSSLEFINYVISGISFNGLTDIRMVIYSPFYGSIFVFTIYATYLLISNQDVRNFHLKATLKLITWFSFIFIFYWILVFNGYVAQSDA